jgi:hypothetical protein
VARAPHLSAPPRLSFNDRRQVVRSLVQKWCSQYRLSGYLAGIEAAP